MASTDSFIDEDQKSFFHLVLLLYELGNSKLREYFKKEWPAVLKKHSHPIGNWANGTADGNLCWKLVNTTKLKIHFPDQRIAIQYGNIEQWDASLLTTILLHVNFGFVLKPSKEFDALKYIKGTRNNCIAHSPNSRIAKADFSKFWQDSCVALKVFGATEDEFADIEKKLEHPTEELRKRLQEHVDKEKELKNRIAELTDLARESNKGHEETHRGVKSILKRLYNVEEKLTNSHDNVGGTIKKKCKEVPPKILLLKERLFHFTDDVTPADVLENLRCLSEEEKDEILLYKSKNGNPNALEFLVTLLCGKDKGFDQFVVALRKADLNHVAALLDPDENVSEEDVYTDDETKTFEVIAGSVIDVCIAVHRYEEQKRQMIRKEEIASEFRYPSSKGTRDLRKKITEFLPKGVHFVRIKTLETKRRSEQQERVESDDMDIDDNTEVKDYMHSVVVVFRFVSVKSIDEFWKCYQCRELLGEINSLFMETAQIPDTDNLRIELDFPKVDYMEAKRKLEEVESKQVNEKAETQQVTTIRYEEQNIAPVKYDNHHINIPPVFLEDDPVVLRQYQKELAKHALDGKNTIICAPTNSGKTYVAMDIAKRHLECYDKKDKESDKVNPKVIFIVNTQNLILQQSQRFEEFLSGRYVVKEISGSNSTEITLKCLLEESNVIVLTAQILVNALEKDDVHLSQITLLIFDECHHANKEHVYNKIMQKYVAIKHQPSQIRLPKVIGLTASLGVGKANNPEEAEKHILQLCANLDSQCISTVIENIDELKEHVTDNVPVGKRIQVKKGPRNCFEEIFSQVMKTIEEDCKKMSPDFKSPPCDRVMQQYRQWLEDLEKHAINSKVSRELITYAEHLKRYHRALVLNNFVQMKDAMDSLERRDEKSTTNVPQMEVDLRKMFYDAKKCIEDYVQKKGEPINPTLQTLKDELVRIEKNSKQNSEWKGILFSPTRESTNCLKRWITQTEELNTILKPEVLIGEGDKESGMKKSQQDAAIKKFNAGEINLLIATTVAEEGLDITTCSFVIRYNMMGNEISSVQSRGRVRAKDGESVYITDARSKGVERERLNDIREMLMIGAVENVRCIPSEDYTKQVNAIQRDNIQGNKIKAMEASKKKMTFLPKDITFYCRKCGELACKADDIRRIRESYHVVINPNFKERMVVKSGKSKTFEDIVMDKKIYCKECKNDWGVIAKIDDLEWPCIKILGFRLKLKDGGESRGFPKWKDVPVTILEFSSEEKDKAFQSIGNN